MRSSIVIVGVSSSFLIAVICICGTQLSEGAEPHRHVTAYLDKAGLADVEETVICMGAQIEAIDRLKQVKENRDVVFRKQLEQQIEALYGQISFKAYVPRLSDRYELSLVEVAGGQDVLVGASTGENQILSLSFIGSVIERVRHWSKAGLIMGPDSSTFPVVMDSPFGNLDEIYRRQVARLVPLLANQLVVMASQTQWRGEVEQEMQPRIGREYVLTFNSSKSDCEEASIQRYGQVYPLVRQSPNEFEYTEIIEVMRE